MRGSRLYMALRANTGSGRSLAETLLTSKIHRWVVFETLSTLTGFKLL